MAARAWIYRPLCRFERWEALAQVRAQPPEGDPAAAEGLMLKRWDSLYEAGRPKGPGSSGSAIPSWWTRS